MFPPKEHAFTQKANRKETPTNRKRILKRGSILSVLRIAPGGFPLTLSLGPTPTRFPHPTSVRLILCANCTAHKPAGALSAGQNC